MAQRVHVVSVHTESGDNYGPFVFERKPDDARLKAFLRKRLPSDDLDSDEGPGWCGTYVHLKWTVQRVHAV